MSSRTIAWNGDDGLLWPVAVWAIRPLFLALEYPSLLYVVAMTVFLFRPPDVSFFYADRIAFGALAFFVALRTMARRETFPFFAGISVPMIGLTTLAIARALREPFDAQLWSIVASKFIVPFALFHFAVLVFRGPVTRRHFEIFTGLALAYLTFTAIAFLADAHSLIFPRYILDESIGFHADRARGPFLQAVANGVSLNLLGILVLVLPQKNRTLGWLLWVGLPVAILATMTRAVWIAFVASTLVLGLRLVQHKLRAICAVLVIGGVVGGFALLFSNCSIRDAIWDRTTERGPVAARMAVYRAGWSMFEERPLSGWPAGRMYAELGRRMESYHLRVFYVHNTYLALLVEFGVPGLALYAILFFNLFRLSRRAQPNECLTVARLRKVWPLLLWVYLFNAFFVDMAYQFVNGLLFTVAGMLCASEEMA